eukprot:Seg143.4 transcript_id=Seg143.4/GoldUCD/mRNA.D3Y31 product="hypothetical protein" protein_id=Seg143.4/GoldUCD/D3Y31
MIFGGCFFQQNSVDLSQSHCLQTTFMMAAPILERESSFTVNTSVECNRSSSQFWLLDEEGSEDCDIKVRELSEMPAMTATPQQLDTAAQTSTSARRVIIGDILRPFWDQGMTDLSSNRGKQLAKEAMTKNPSITKNQIKDWMGNNRKKISGRKRNRAKNSNCSIRKRKRTARDMFQEDFLKRNGGNMKGLETGWAEVLRDSKKLDIYKQSANDANKEGVVLTDKEKQTKALKIRKEMQNLSAELAKIGFECLGLVVKPNTNRCAHFGTARGKDFLDRGNTYWEFLSQVNVGQKERDTEEWEDLRTAVQDKLNRCYRGAVLRQLFQMRNECQKS